MGGTKFRGNGLVTQPESSSPQNMYIPLSRAQALASDPGTGTSMHGKIDTAYVAAASAAGIGAGQQDGEHLLRTAAGSRRADLAGEGTGSAASAPRRACAPRTRLAGCGVSSSCAGAT